ncbi:hypothetical protein QCA50_014893 [Cerrena zonata]|uniref:G-protein coupled receptors family 1 profile domain-containing protein n=1 Tax=Cerrena zonata TaxID=2478898 RepID=A0AAW0FX30_9APHY
MDLSRLHLHTSIACVMSTSSQGAAVQLQVFQDGQTIRYIGLATTTIFLYDFILGLAEDVRMVSSHSLCIPTFVYFTSRVLVVALIPFEVARIALPLDSCLQETIITVAKWLAAIVIPCNCWLFLLRIQAIHKHSRIIITSFIVLWASTLTFPLINAFSYTVVIVRKEDGTCAATARITRLLVAIPFIALVSFDTAVMVAVSMYIVKYNPAQSWKEKVKILMQADHISQIERVLLRSGQIYYTATIGVHASLTVMVLLDSFSAVILAVLAIFGAVFQNIIVCRVFRLLKLAMVQDHDDVSSFTPVVFASNISSLNHPTLTLPDSTLE